MQKVFLTLLFTAGLFFLGAGEASAQHVYVKAVPHETVNRRPSRPSPHHVWVGTEYRERDGKYAEVPGHWEVPPHGHKTWVAGRWTRTSRGSYWVAGHWR